MLVVYGIYNEKDNSVLIANQRYPAWGEFKHLNDLDLGDIRLLSKNEAAAKRKLGELKRKVEWMESKNIDDGVYKEARKLYDKCQNCKITKLELVVVNPSAQLPPNGAQGMSCRPYKREVTIKI